MITADLLGWSAAGLVLASFYLKTMVPLRTVAIASNIAFASYGLLADAAPVLVLHCLLLPLNLTRLIQAKGLGQRIKRASRGQLPLEALLPHMHLRVLQAGTRLFERGDHADTVYLVLKGRVRLLGTGMIATPGQLVGAIGLFLPEQRRIDAALCETAVELGAIDEDKVWELFNRDPAFGAHLLRIVTARTATQFEGRQAREAA
jgi:CRP-like cAMP-binding protein